MSGNPISWVDPTSGYTVTWAIPTLTGNVTITFPGSTGSLLNTAVNSFNTPVDFIANSATLPTRLTNVLLNCVGNTSDYIQNNLQNLNSQGTSDYTLTADDGSDSNYYATIGYNNSAYSGTYMVGAHGAYFSCLGGDIAIGTGTAAKNVYVYTGGETNANVRAMFSDTKQCIYIGGNSTGLEARLGGVIWVKTAQTSLASWTTATSCIGNVNTGVGTLTIPANTLIAGRKIRFRLSGTMQSTSVVPTMGVKVTFGGTTMADTGSQSVWVQNATFGMSVEGEITCCRTGSSATCIANLRWMFSNQSSTLWIYTGNGTVQNINTASSNTIDILATCGSSSANNKFIVEQCDIEIIG